MYNIVYFEVCCPHNRNTVVKEACPELYLYTHIPTAIFTYWRKWHETKITNN